MRFVMYAEMLKQPIGTVFYKCKDCVGELEGPYVMQLTNEIDLYYCQAFPDVHMKGYYSQQDQRTLDPIQRDDHMALSAGGTREGCFEQDACYLVLDASDVQRTIDILLGKEVEPSICSAKDVPAWNE